MDVKISRRDLPDFSGVHVRQSQALNKDLLIDNAGFRGFRLERSGRACCVLNKQKGHAFPVRRPRWVRERTLHAAELSRSSTVHICDIKLKLSGAARVREERQTFTIGRPGDVM